MRDKSYIGRRYPRVEDHALVRGAGRFVDDLKLPGLLEAAFLRSPVAHGVIRSINVSKARALPGVHAVYTLADLRPVLTADRLPLQFPSTVLPPDISPFILAGKEVSCKETKTTATMAGSETSTVFLSSDAVPGGMVRMEMTMNSSGMNMSTVTEVTAFEAK